MITPTFTMAKLYEKQGEFTHALGVYHLLAKTDKQAKKKVKELSKKLFESSDLLYNPLISLIFDKQQLKSIKLLPNSEYKKLMLEETESVFYDDSAQADDNNEAKEDTDEHEQANEDLDLELDVGINLEDFKKIAKQEPEESPAQEEPSVCAQPTPSDDLPKESQKSFDEMSVADLLKTLEKHCDHQTNLSQITVGQIKSFLNL